VAISSIGDPVTKMLTADCGKITGAGKLANVLTLRADIAPRHNNKALMSFADGHVEMAAFTSFPLLSADPPTLLYTYKTGTYPTSGLAYYKEMGSGSIWAPTGELETAMRAVGLSVLMGWPTTATAPVCYPATPAWLGTPAVTVVLPVGNTTPGGMGTNVNMSWGASLLVRALQQGGPNPGYSTQYTITPVATMGYKHIGLVFASGRIGNCKSNSGATLLNPSTIAVAGGTAQSTPICDVNTQGSPGARTQVANVVICSVPVVTGQAITITLNSWANGTASGGAFLAFEP
jgi:prepilin-type processing-associated H-X9-DG protein